MEKHIEIKTTLYDQMKEENTRLSEKLQVKFSLEKVIFNYLIRLKLLEITKKNIEYK
jgi:cell shape-determining protein MreC